MAQTLDRYSLASILKIAAAPFALAAVTAMVCYLAAGNGLGFYLGPIVAASFIIPPIVAAVQDRLSAVIAAGAVVDAIGIVWLFTVPSPDVTFTQWLACYAVLAAYVLALAGVVWVLRQLIGALAAAFITVLVALAWLGWPIWTSPWITARLAAWLSPAHPLMAINHIMLDMGVWTQGQWMYQHTVLGQDVPYALPESIWPCVILHGVMGLALAWPTRDARRTDSSPEPSQTPAGS
ncbi:MAG: hypothetical protein ABIP55_05305 [Tepidisphaeraceae bacterium]